jgi:ABC-type glycerol-3-phosphate transport system substrate-binding protein
MRRFQYLVSILGLLALIGCSALPVPNQPIATPEAVATSGATIIRFTTTSFSASRMQQAAEQFHQNQTAIFVELQIADPASGFTNLAASHDCFTWPALPKPYEREALIDLRLLFDADQSIALSEFPQGLLSLFEEQGRLYGIPDEVIVPTLSYHPGSLQAAGLSYPAEDLTPDVFLTLGLQLTSGSGADRRYGYGSLDEMPQDLQFFLARFAASPLIAIEGTLQPDYTNPRVRDAIQYYISLLRETSPHTRFLGYRTDLGNNPAPSIADQGRIAIWLNSGTSTGRSAVAVNSTLAAAPLGGTPFREDELLMSGLYISSNSSNTGTCWQWLKALTALPANNPPAANAALRMVARAQTTPAQLTAEQQVATNAFATLNRGITRYPASGIREPLNLYWFYQAIDQALQGSDLDQALIDAQTTTEQWLACVQAGEETTTCALLVDPGYPQR